MNRRQREPFAAFREELRLISFRGKIVNLRDNLAAFRKSRDTVGGVISAFERTGVFSQFVVYDFFRCDGLPLLYFALYTVKMCGVNRNLSNREKIFELKF